MKTITELQKIINQAIAEKQYTGSPKELYEPINYLMDLGGKRMRPVLLLMACNLYTNNIDGAINPALGIEVFHNFTLVHDDIMDQAPLRRGKPTVHKKWNENIAILSGDVMLVESYKLMMQVNPEILIPVLNTFNNTAVGVCEGQQIDMNFEKRNHVEAEEYINMIRLKTAILLGCALKIGALIGGSSKTDAELLYDFGVNLGIAFQLQDDILDVYGDPEKFGKQVGGDIISNKKTFMLIKAKELANGHLADDLDQWLNYSADDVLDKINAVISIYNSLQVKELAQTEMNGFVKKALESLDKVSIDNKRKENLKTFADQLLVREN
ncbi:MAG: polyprenyl synthetase family protein [Daejeonella sp.]